MRIRPPRTLGAHLALAYTLTFVVLLGAALGALRLAAAAELDRRIDEDLVEDIDELARAWRDGGDAAVAKEIARETALDGREEVFLMLLDASGDPLVISDLESWPGAAPPGRAAVAALVDDEPTLATERYAGRDSAARTALGRIDATRFVYISESFEERDELLELLGLGIAGVFLLGVPLASLLVWLIGRRATRGIGAVGAAATAIAGGELERRVDPAGQLAEVHALATAFNAMAARNQKLIDDMRDMTDNVAHDLRSPLTRVRIIAETALFSTTDERQCREAAADIVSECDRLMTLINHALDVSEAEAGISRTPLSRIDVSEIAGGVVELFDALAEQREIQLATDLAPALIIEGERPAIERVVANLVDNALKFTPAGGEIRVAGRAEADEIVLTVEDTGSGIPRDRLERVFDRYYRVDDSRTEPGCGLGLSYVRAVSRLHGGEATAESVAGGGARFSVRLPAFRPRRSRAAGVAPRHERGDPVAIA